MNRKKQVLLALFILLVLLISGCGERTTIRQQIAIDEPGEKQGDELDVFSITIVAFAFDSSVEDSPVTVRWEAEGDFGEGFMVAWSPYNPAPMPGVDGWVPVTDSEVREIQIKLTSKEPHYFRICRVKDDACDGFSDTIQVVFPDSSEFGVDQQNSVQNEQQTTIVATPTMELTPTPEFTQIPEAQIEIDEITTSNDGIVTVSWKVVSGSAPLGFRVNWSNATKNPTEEDSSVYLQDSDTRSYAIEGFGRGYEYYFSVCQAIPDGCLATTGGITYRVPLAKTLTPTPKSGEKTPTPTYSADELTLTGLAEASAGQVKVNWSAEGSFPKGFKIVWSTSSNTPVYPGDSYARISDSSLRSAYVKNLTPGKTYYFRVCRYTGSTCDLYSNTRSITLSSSTVSDSITLTSITDAGCGAVKLIWNASGTFPNGFKIAYSSHNTTPVYPGDSYEYVSNGATRSVIIDGLIKGETYYFRVCKYDGGGCTMYSNMKQFTIPCTENTKTPTLSPTPDTSTITLNPIIDEGSGAVTVQWAASGSFPNGFKVVWSDVHTSPVFPGDSYYYASSPSTASAYLTGFTAGTTYYFRVCRYTGSTCDLYSSVQSIAIPDSVPTKEPVP